MKGDSVAQLEAVLGWLPVLLYHGQRDLLVPLRGTAHMVSGSKAGRRKGCLPGEWPRLGRQGGLPGGRAGALLGGGAALNRAPR